MRAAKTLMVIALTLGAAVLAGADEMYLSGFESPLSLGKIHGQDKWNVQGASPFAVLQNQVVATGSQALQLNGSVTATRNFLYQGSSFEYTSQVYLAPAWGMASAKSPIVAGQRIVFRDGFGSLYAIQAGFARSTGSAYGPIPIGSTGMFLEVVGPKSIVSGTYAPITMDKALAGWRKVDIDLWADGTVVMEIDGIAVLKLSSPVQFSTAIAMQIYNEDNFVNSMKAGAFYDDVNICVEP